MTEGAMIDPVERALEAGFRATFEATKALADEGPEYTPPSPELRTLFIAFWAAANRSLAADPPAAMVEAGAMRMLHDEAWSTFWDDEDAKRLVRAALPAALTALADKLEARHAE